MASTSSSANKDEALVCAARAKEALSASPPDTLRATRFAEKAVRLYACPETTSVLLQAQAMAAEAEARAEQRPAAGARAGGAAGAAGGSGGAANGSGPRQRHPPAAAAQTTTTPNGGGTATPEQVALVSTILRARTHYDVLGLTRREADDDAIKKAYRRLALKLHPDKCDAPKSEEAFKAVSRAFSVLSDPDKRAYYDRTGHDSTAQAAAAAQQERQQRAQQFQRRGGGGGGGGGGGMGGFYEGEIDPDEIFNMFFGGNPFGGGMRTHTVFRQYGGGQPAARPAHAAQHAQHADAAAARAGLASLAQLLPLLLVVFLTLFSSRPEPTYVLAAGGDGAGGTGAYREGLVTARLSVPFYVRSAADFSRKYPSNSRARLRIDREIEGDYYDRVHVRCSHEMLSKQRAAAWGGRAAREKAAAMATPYCDELASLNARLSAGGGARY